MPKFIVKNTTIFHDQISYGIGKEIELTDKIQIAKLADYITPVATAKVASASTAENVSKPASKQSADSTATATTKTTKSSKKADTTITPIEDTTCASAGDIATTDPTVSTDEVAGEKKKEDPNGTETV